MMFNNNFLSVYLIILITFIIFVFLFLCYEKAIKFRNNSKQLVFIILMTICVITGFFFSFKFYREIQVKIDETEKQVQKEAKQEAERSSLVKNSSVQYKDYPIIYIEQNVGITVGELQDVENALDAMPKNIIKSTASISIVSEQTMNSKKGNLSYTPSYMSFPSDNTILLLHNDYIGKTNIVDSIVHLYDCNHHITYDSQYNEMQNEFLSHYKTKICKAYTDADAKDSCLNSSHETFNLAIELYTEKGNILPDTVKQWIDSLPE